MIAIAPPTFSISIEHMSRQRVGGTQPRFVLGNSETKARALRLTCTAAGLISPEIRNLSALQALDLRGNKLRVSREDGNSYFDSSEFSRKYTINESRRRVGETHCLWKSKTSVARLRPLPYLHCVRCHCRAHNEGAGKPAFSRAPQSLQQQTER